MTAKWGYNSTNEQIITKTTQPGSFDLVIITSALLGQLRLLNRIAPIDVSLLPNWTKLDPFFRNTPLSAPTGRSGLFRSTGGTTTPSTTPTS